MAEDLVLIKFGGSLITNKSKTCSAKYKVIDKLCKAVNKIMAMGKKVIIVHGAGGYGHIKAKKWRISEGLIFENRKNQYDAINEIRADMMSLNEIIISNLVKYSIDAESHPPHKNGSGLGLKYTLNKKFFDLLDDNKLPVTYGDVVDSNTEKEFGILSGDDLCELICEKLKPSHVIFTIDGALGLIDDPNLSNGGNLIRNFIPGSDVVTTEVLNDVTGGMALKLKRAVNCYYSGARVSIINGNHVDMIIKAVRGDDFLGTEFTNNDI